MAYKKSTQRILTGGLNLLHPSDVVDDDEATELLNMSVDSFGALRSRKGHTVRHTLGANVVKITKALGDIWYAAGGSVYRNASAIISGVSSDKVGLVGWQNFLWAMSATDQRKSDGASNWEWTPTAPSGKPTIKPAVATETTVVDFTSTFTVDPDGDETYNPGLQINAQAETEYSAVLAIALDLRTGFSLDDVFKITLWCKQWKKVNGVTFQIDVNAGDFTTDYYTAEMKQADINAGHKEEVSFYIRKRAMGVDEAAKDKNRYGHFERIGTTPEKDYRSCVSVRVKVDFSDTTKLRFVSWTMIGDASGTLEGDDYKLYYTYTTDAGHESNPSDGADAITVNHTGIDVSAMTASGDAQATGQLEYLIGGRLGHIYRVRNTPVVGTTDTITESEDDLTELGFQLEFDHDAVPSVGGLIGPYYGRLIAFGGSKFYWSHTNKPYAFSGAQLDAGDWTSIEEGIGDLQAATMRPGILYLYGENGVVVIQGDPGDLSSAVHRAAVQMGILTPNGVVQSPRGDFASMFEGAYMFNGDSAQLLSKKIDPIFKDGTFDPSSAAVGYRNEIYWLSDANASYKFDSLTDRWFKDSRAFTTFYNDGSTFLGALAGGSGKIVELETGFTDDGVAIPIAYKTKAYNQGILDNEKVYNDFTIWIDTGGETVTVQAYLNDGQDDETIIALGTVSSTSKERFVLQFTDEDGEIGRNCAIRITGSVSAEVVIYERTFNWYPKAREGKSFDTSEQDFGTHKVKILRQLMLDMDNPATVNITVKSDRPQPMANRSTSLSVATTSDRRMQPIIFTDEIIGRLFRVTLDGADFRSYGGKALFQVFGTYLEGADGEYYLSDPLDFGSERVKLLREIEVVYSGAGGTFTVSTDLPGNEIVARGTATFPAVTGEQSIKVRVDGFIKGRLYQAKFEPDGDSRIEAIRFEIKMVGEPNASPWQWLELPLVKTQDAVWQDLSFGADEIG